MTEGLIVVASILAVSSLGYWWWNSRDGRVKRLDEPEGALSSEVLGGKRGARATFVQFSTPMCAKCPGTRVLLQRVASEYPGVTHIDIDASERLDMAREFDVMRTPTILVLNHLGVPVARMSGAPSEAQAREALEQAPPPTIEYSI